MGLTVQKNEASDIILNLRGVLVVAVESIEITDEVESLERLETISSLGTSKIPLLLKSIQPKKFCGIADACIALKL